MTVSCDDGFISPLGFDFVVTCDPSGAGTSTLSGIEVCHPLLCFQEDLVANSFSANAGCAAPDGLIEGETCTGFCRAGFTASYTTFDLTCSSTGFMFEASGSSGDLSSLCPADSTTELSDESESGISVQITFEILSETELTELEMLIIEELGTTSDRISVTQDLETGVVTVQIVPSSDTADTTVSQLYNDLLASFYDPNSAFSTSAVVSGNIVADSGIVTGSLESCSDGSYATPGECPDDDLLDMLMDNLLYVIIGAAAVVIFCIGLPCYCYCAGKCCFNRSHDAARSSQIQLSSTTTRASVKRHNPKPVDTSLNFSLDDLASGPASPPSKLSKPRAHRRNESMQAHIINTDGAWNNI
jgi:hypothetical protein